VDPETRAYLDEMRREINQRLDGVDRRLDGVDQRFDAVDQRFDGVDQRFESADRRVVQLGVLIEQVRHEVQTVAEMVVANTEAIAGLRLRLDTR
jgi:archaellum component FlaC